MVLKRKRMLISAITLLLMLTAGCNYSGEEKNQPSGEGYEIKGVKMGINDSGKFTVLGKLKNMGEKKGYTEISIPCYDKKGVKLENAFDSVESIDAGGEWEFRAEYQESGEPSRCDINESEVTTY